MHIYKKFIAGSETRKTRLHDELGRLAPLSRVLRNGPKALLSACMAQFGFRSRRPWISYDAQKLIRNFLTADKRVLEFGSGYSTLWYSQHAGEVLSIEDDRDWYNQVAILLKKDTSGNVRYRLADNAVSYSQLLPDEVGAGFDVVMIDGSHRDLCVANALSLVRQGGMIYLDNSDKGECPISGDVPGARQQLVDFAIKNGAVAIYFTDFAPTQLFVQEGLLVCLPRGT